MKAETISIIYQLKMTLQTLKLTKKFNQITKSNFKKLIMFVNNSIKKNSIYIKIICIQEQTKEEILCLLENI